MKYRQHKTYHFNPRQLFMRKPVNGIKGDELCRAKCVDVGFVPASAGGGMSARLSVAVVAD